MEVLLYQCVSHEAQSSAEQHRPAGALTLAVAQRSGLLVAWSTLAPEPSAPKCYGLLRLRALELLCLLCQARSKQAHDVLAMCGAMQHLCVRA